MPPVNPEARGKKQLIERQWKGAEGLAEDVRYYGKWMRDEAEKRIGHLYPKVLITPEMVNDPENPRPDLKLYEGQELTVIAWLWARTVKSPNPAFSQVEVPLASTFMLSSKTGKEAYVEPVVGASGYHFKVKMGIPENATAAKDGTKFSRGNFRCLMSGDPIEPEHVKSEAKADHMNARLMAVVAEGLRGRVYLKPTPEQEAIAHQARPHWKPDVEFFQQALGFRVGNYGMTKWSDLFTDRQLVALTTFSGLVGEAMQQVCCDAIEAGRSDEPTPLRHGGKGALAYAEAVRVYLGMSVSKLTDAQTTLCRWKTSMDQSIATFGRQALPMTWDYSEANAIGGMAGDPLVSLMNMMRVIDNLPTTIKGISVQQDSQSQKISLGRVVSTDPPYYDNIGYADLSDFFYVWLRRSLKPVFPELFATLAVPKAEELVATPYRHGGKERAEVFFLNGMTQAMHQLAVQAHTGFPLTIYYAFKQSETKESAGTASTGWETFLAAVIEAGLAITGTWPMRTELANRMRGMESNALATSMVLVCQRRDPSAAILSRNAFRRELRQRLPQAIKELEHANIAPVDVAQAAIGPGMAIFSQAKAVLNPDDSPMSVREALIEINAALDEHLSQDEGAFDADTRFALTFFESFGYGERPYGDAEGLAVARNISVDGVVRSGILRAAAGKAQLLRREQLDDSWDPAQDDRLCVWEATQQLIKQLETDGEAGAAALLLQLKNLPGQADLAASSRALAYRLYNHCEKTKQAEEARSYNGLVIAWPELERQSSAASSAQSAPRQTTLI
jgi:putative DNA methylase